jgi:hypothetical protein
MAVSIGQTFKPGDKVEASGIYKVIHDTQHAQEHEVTCVYGKPFPPCNHCGHHVRFVLLRAAHHISTHDYFS